MSNQSRYTPLAVCSRDVLVSGYAVLITGFAAARSSGICMYINIHSVLWRWSALSGMTSRSIPCCVRNVRFAINKLMHPPSPQKAAPTLSVPPQSLRRPFHYPPLPRAVARQELNGQLGPESETRRISLLTSLRKGPVVLDESPSDQRLAPQHCHYRPLALPNPQ